MKNSKLINLLFVLIIVLFSSNLLFAQEEIQSISSSNNDTTKEEISKKIIINKNIEIQNTSSNTIEEKLVIKDSKIKNNDTIYVIKENEVETFILKNIERSKRIISKARVQGYGGGGGWSPRLGFIDMAPVKKLLDNFVTGFDFTNIDDGFAPFIMSGGLGYGGIGNGIRLGGGGWNGSQTFQSKINSVDTLATINAAVNYGGFLIEKVFVRNRLNTIFGGIIGGGQFDIHKTESRMESSSIFKVVDSETSNSSYVTADFFFLELHSAFTYTIIPWMHIGGDINSAFFLSNDGFTDKFQKSNTGGFMTINPGFSIRIIWGNLG